MPIKLPSPTAWVKSKILALQEFSLLTGRTVRALLSPPVYWGDIAQQMDLIGVGSLPIVVLTGFFTGCVLALQAATALKEFGAISKTGNLVALSMVKELGPVLTGLMVSGRNASGMASELGSMKVTEQIDAMRALGVDPIRKLVAPRISATVFMLFWLSILSMCMGILGGGLVAVFMLGLDSHAYFTSSYSALVWADLWQGLTKPVFFGFIISSVGCYYGMQTKGGTQGVGRATTEAVVASSILIIVSDFILTRLMIGILGR